MAKPKRRYVCTECGSVTSRWQGQCVDCSQWNTLVEDAPETAFSARHDLSGGGRVVAFEPLDAPVEALTRRSTGLTEFDRAFGLAVDLVERRAVGDFSPDPIASRFAVFVPLRKVAGRARPRWSC